VIEFVVIGLPAPQGSKRFVGHANSGRGVLVESCKAVKPWREAVKYAAMEHVQRKISGPVVVSMTFTLPKPKSAPKKRTLPDRKPDLSKLVRSSEDAISEIGLWEDDARITTCLACKLYVGDPLALPAPGALIRIAEAR
jgi:crossover junction endodeoxyribonuclease RusA